MPLFERAPMIRKAIFSFGLAALLCGCATKPLAINGRALPPGSPVAIRGGPIDQDQYFAAQSLLEAYGFKVVSKDAADPEYVFFIDVGRDGGEARLSLLKDLQPIASVEGNLIRPSDDTSHFGSLLHDFEQALDSAR
jgi:hypothetical protein